MSLQNTKITNIAKDLLKSQGYFVDNLWHINDIHFICEQNNVAALTDEQAMEIFTIAKEQFDGEIGLSWPQLEKALHTYIHRRNMVHTMRRECESDSL